MVLFYESQLLWNWAHVHEPHFHSHNSPSVHCLLHRSVQLSMKLTGKKKKKKCRLRFSISQNSCHYTCDRYTRLRSSL